MNPISRMSETNRCSLGNGPVLVLYAAWMLDRSRRENLSSASRFEGGAASEPT